MVNSDHESLQENMQRSLNRALAEFLKHFLNFEKAPPSRAYLKDNFPAIATATSPHPPSTKSAVVDTRRRRILRSLFYVCYGPGLWIPPNGFSKNIVFIHQNIFIVPIQLKTAKSAILITGINLSEEYFDWLGFHSLWSCQKWANANLARSNSPQCYLRWWRKSWIR